MHLRRLVALAVIGGVALAAHLRADLIIDTGTPLSGAYTWLGYGGGSPYSQNLAAEFTLTQATTITSVEGYMSVFDAGNLSYSIAAGGGQVPGAALFSTSVAYGTSLPADWYGVSGLNWILGAGTYWLVFEAGPGFFGGMQSHSPFPLGNEAYTWNQNGLWYEYDDSNIGVRINGSVAGVPDGGSSVLLIGAAFALIAGIRRRRA